ncbi:hypothetical protein DFJ74DRAFT_477082 [Hyaloraphidium curvatum]|nr:hypothetical protein DFJ74DRAFT_477082 [Hyaloraphidium curvatum]
MVSSAYAAYCRKNGWRTSGLWSRTSSRRAATVGDRTRSGTQQPFDGTSPPACSQTRRHLHARRETRAVLPGTGRLETTRAAGHALDQGRAHGADRGGAHGSSYACFLYDQLFVKEPKTEDSTPFHQDRPYWAVGGDQVCSFWVPLDPIDKATCVEYVRGSHRWREFNAIKFQPGNALYRGANLPVLPDMDAAKAAGEHEFLAWDMEPGDMIVFNAMTVHGSKGNLRMGTRRRAWAFRFVGDDHAFLDQPGREWGWPVVDLWSQGLTNGDKLVGHPDHPVVWKRPEVKL